MMSYRIEYAPKASKFLRQLTDMKLLQRFDETIGNLATNPRPVGSAKLVGMPYHRVRVGDYRVIYKIEDDVLLVLVAEIGHRKDVYR